MKKLAGFLLGLGLVVGTSCWRAEEDGYRYSCGSQDDCVESDGFRCTGVDIADADHGHCSGSDQGLAAQREGDACFYLHCVLGGARECGDLVCSEREVCVTRNNELFCAEEAPVMTNDRRCDNNGVSFEAACPSDQDEQWCYLVFDPSNVSLESAPERYRCIRDSEIRS